MVEVRTWQSSQLVGQSAMQALNQNDILSLIGGLTTQYVPAIYSGCQLDSYNTSTNTATFSTGFLRCSELLTSTFAYLPYNCPGLFELKSGSNTLVLTGTPSSGWIVATLVITPTSSGSLAYQLTATLSAISSVTSLTDYQVRLCGFTWNGGGTGVAFDTSYEAGNRSFDWQNTLTSASSGQPYVGFKNLLMNGDFYIDQRLECDAVIPVDDAPVCVGDRWSFTKQDVDLELQTVKPTTNQYAPYEISSYFQAQVTDTGTFSEANLFQMLQFIPDLTRFEYSSVTYTLSFYAKISSANLQDMDFVSESSLFTFTVSDGIQDTGTFTLVSGSFEQLDTWTRFVFNFTVPSPENLTDINWKEDLYLGISIIPKITSETTFDGNEILCISKVQVEKSPYATAYEARPLQVELSMCQAFCEKSYDFGIKPGTADTALNGAVFNTVSVTSFTSAYSQHTIISAKFSTPKVKYPSITVFYSPETGDSDNLAFYTTGTTVDGGISLTPQYISLSGIMIYAPKVSATIYIYAGVHWIVDSEIYL